MKYLEHIGIAVKDLEASQELFDRLLNTKPYKTEEVPLEQVRTVFYRSGESKIELLEATGPESAIARHIEKRGEGIHHIAFEVKDIHKEMERLKEEGFRIINEKPKKGADNKWVAFLHPKSSNGVLIELCQEIKAERSEE